MRWCAILECTQEEAELLIGLRLVDAQRAKDFLLNVVVMDTNRTTANLDTIENRVVSQRLDVFGALYQRVEVVWMWCGKWVVRGDVTPAFVIALEEREVGDPTELVLVRLVELALLRHMLSKIAECWAIS